jgi:hypothetical protein
MNVRRPHFSRRAADGLCGRTGDCASEQQRGLLVRMLASIVLIFAFLAMPFAHKLHVELEEQGEPHAERLAATHAHPTTADDAADLHTEDLPPAPHERHHHDERDCATCVTHAGLGLSIFDFAAVLIGTVTPTVPAIAESAPAAVSAWRTPVAAPRGPPLA